jgi:hypothetical protein
MMISENTPLLCSPGTPPDDRSHELPDPGLDELNTEDQWEDQWVNDFIQRLNYAVQDLGQKIR